MKYFTGQAPSVEKKVSSPNSTLEGGKEQTNVGPVREMLLPRAKRPDKVKKTRNLDKYNLPIVQRWYVKDYKKGKHITQMYIGLGEHTGGQYYGGWASHLVYRNFCKVLYR